MSNKQAFPHKELVSVGTGVNNQIQEEYWPGMTLREYYAAKAMQGLIQYHGSYGKNAGPEEISDRAFEIADAMIRKSEE